MSTQGATHRLLPPPRWWRRATTSGVTGAVVAGLMVLAPGQAQAAGTTYTVDNSTTGGCNDTTAPTSGPYCTITAAVKAAASGATITVGPGTYNERVDVTTAGITLQGTNGVTIDGGGATPLLYGIKVAAPNVTVDGFTFVNQTASASAAGVFVDGTVAQGANNAVVRNVTVTGSAGNGIRVTSGTNTTITNARVSGSASVGVLLQGCTGCTVSSSTTNNNNREGVSIQGGSNDVVENVTSYANDSAGDGIVTRLAPGINVTSWSPGGVTQTASGITVQRNVTYGNDDSGIQVYGGSQNVTVRRNLTYDNSDHGIDISQASTATVVSNTVVHNYTAGINIESNSATPAVGSNGTVSDNLSTNNGYGDRTHGDIRVDDASVAGSTIDHDLVFDSNGQTVLTWGKTTYPSLDAFHKDVPAQEVHGVQGDPKLDASYVPGAGSAAIDAADASAPGWTGTDLNGNSPVNDPTVTDTGPVSPTYADLGAIERTKVNQPPAAKLTATPASLSAGGTATLDATGSTDDGPITGYAFDCGNGTPATVGQNQATATCTYPTAGSYTAQVTVTDNAGGTGSAQAGITVNAVTPPGGGGGGGPVNAPPTAKLTATPGTVAAGGKVTLDATASTDDGTITGYAFDCGNGTTATVGQNPAMATCSYPATGGYSAQVTVTDDQGVTNTAKATVTVTTAAHVAPTAQLKGGWVRRGHPIRLDARGSHGNGGAAIVSYLFRCGAHTIGPKAGARTPCAFRRLGLHRVSVKVTDSNGMTSRAFAWVRVIRSAPVARLSLSERVIKAGGSLVASARRSHGSRLSRLQDVRFVCGNGQRSAWGTARTFRCRFDQPGRYTVTVVVRNTDGLRAKATRNVRVRRD